MQAQWPVIEVSAGDMALALMGVKTRHVAAIKPPQKLEDHAILQCRLNGQTLRYPIVIESHAHVHAHARIPGAMLADYGFTKRAAKPASPTRPTGDDASFDHDRYKLHRPGEAARALTQDHPRFQPKKRYHARDIAKHKKWLVDIQFHPLGQAERLPPEEARTYRDLAMHAQKLLHTELLQTRSFVLHDPTTRYGGIATKLSMQRAILLLLQQNIAEEASIGQRFAQTLASLRKVNYRAGDPVSKPQQDPLPDGLGQGQLLAAIPSIDIALGTASQIYMGTVRHVVLRERPTIPEAYRNGNYCPPLPMRLAAQSRVSDRGHVAHHVDLPMQLDMMEERVIDTRHLTDTQACELGYPHAKAMRRALGIQPGMNVALYLYPVTMTQQNELPFDRDRTGSRLNGYRRDFRDAWETSSDPSMKHARDHHAQLPAEQQRAAFLRIADYEEMSGNELKNHLNNQGTRPVPNDVRAERMHAVAGETMSAGAEKPAKKPRRQKEPRKKTEGEGWVLTVAKGTQARTRHPKAANNDGKPTSKKIPLTPEERRQITEERRLLRALKHAVGQDPDPVIQDDQNLPTFDTVVEAAEYLGKMRKGPAQTPPQEKFTALVGRRHTTIPRNEPSKGRE